MRGKTEGKSCNLIKNNTNLSVMGRGASKERAGVWEKAVCVCVGGGKHKYHNGTHYFLC